MVVLCVQFLRHTAQNVDFSTIVSGQPLAETLQLNMSHFITTKIIRKLQFHSDWQLS